MNKVITLQEAKPAFEEVIQDIYASVLATLGPNGKTIVTFEDDGKANLTKDGVTVAKALLYDDALKQTILNLLRETSTKTAAKVGDGTTTSMLLTVNLLSNVLDSNTLSVLSLLDQIENAVDHIVDEINHFKIPIIDKPELLKGLILTSVNRDVVLADLLYDIYKIIGTNGIINIIPTVRSDSYVEYQDGIGFSSKIVAAPTDTAKSELVINNVYVALVEGDIKSVNDIATLLRSSELSTTGLLIIAKSFSKEVINVVNINNSRGSRSVVLLEAEGFSPTRLEILTDIAKLLNTKVFSTDASTSYKLKGIVATDLTLEKGLQIKNKRLVLAPNSSKKNYSKTEDTIKHLNVKLREAVDSEDLGRAKALRLRLSKFVNIANLYIASSTDPEQGEILDRIDDAVSAIKSAMLGGVVPGGGVVLYKASKSLQDTEGEVIVAAMCQSIILNLINSTRLYGNKEKIEEVLDKVNESTTLTFDVVNEEVVDAFKAKIIDPSNVLIHALNNAVSIVRTIANTGSFIIPARDG